MRAWGENNLDLESLVAVSEEEKKRRCELCP